jgi:putative FmdB family regulatory protein
VPIYAYRCSACGHAKDVLQKISDPVLSTCPACGAEAFAKQLTAAGFHLKGSGWYATDFRNGGKSGGAASATSTKTDEPAKSEAGKSEPAKSEPGKPEPAATATAGACGGACACH